ncbi:MAG TPA: beta-ketoacyl synthase N-terminal-like domain-containing protein, partial [Polyangiaceae bacterium]
MKPVAILACGVVSPLGEGAAAFSVGELGARAETRVAHDPALAAAGLRRPNVARVSLEGSGDRARALLERALSLLVAELERVRPGFRRLRIGIALGTSSGGLGTLTELLAERAAGRALDPKRARASSYFGPLSAFDHFNLDPVRVTQVLAACASSTVAMGVASRWLEADLCDLVIAGGYDALTLFAAAGFEALGATT